MKANKHRNRPCLALVFVVFLTGCATLARAASLGVKPEISADLLLPSEVKPHSADAGKTKAKKVGIKQAGRGAVPAGADIEKPNTAKENAPTTSEKAGRLVEQAQGSAEKGSSLSERPAKATVLGQKSGTAGSVNEAGRESSKAPTASLNKAPLQGTKAGVAGPSGSSSDKKKDKEKARSSEQAPISGKQGAGGPALATAAGEKTWPAGAGKPAPLTGSKTGTETGGDAGAEAKPDASTRLIVAPEVSSKAQSGSSTGDPGHAGEGKDAPLEDLAEAKPKPAPEEETSLSNSSGRPASGDRPPGSYKKSIQKKTK